MTDHGFHDVTLLDMADAVGPVVPLGALTTSVASFGGVRYVPETDGP